MNRTEARTLAKTTLEGLGLFAHVYLAEPETFGGNDPVAVVHSKSLAIQLDTRDDVALPVEFFVSIYVARPRDASESEQAAIEEKIDSLARQAMLALWNAIDARELAITSEMGYPTRTFDNKPFRIERFTVRYLDDTEE